MPKTNQGASGNLEDCWRQDTDESCFMSWSDRNDLVDSYARNSPAVAGMVRRIVGYKPRYNALTPTVNEKCIQQLTLATNASCRTWQPTAQSHDYQWARNELIQTFIPGDANQSWKEAVVLWSVKDLCTWLDDVTRKDGEPKADATTRPAQHRFRRTCADNSYLDINLMLTTCVTFRLVPWWNKIALTWNTKVRMFVCTCILTIIKYTHKTNQCHL